MTDNRECDPAAGVVSRRNFLKLGGATLVTVTLPVYLRKAGLPVTLQAQQVDYPRQTIGRLSRSISQDIANPFTPHNPIKQPVKAAFTVLRHSGEIGIRQNTIFQKFQGKGHNLRRGKTVDAILRSLLRNP